MVNQVKVNIKNIYLCDEKMCDDGKVVTDEVTEDGKFVLKDCPKCQGRGFYEKKTNEKREGNVGKEEK